MHMAEYLTTKEVAQYLRLNEKKVYALVSEGQLPAARICGKWLFPRHLVDQWVEKNTVFPSFGLFGALLEELLIIQGSNDWLFSKVIGLFQKDSDLPVACAWVGSVAGLLAIISGRAHLAGYHVEDEKINKLAGDRWGCYLVTLLERRQGIIFDAGRNKNIQDLASIQEQKLKFATRQKLSGTYRLVEKLCDAQGLRIEDFNQTNSYSSHMDLALAIRAGNADAGVGIQIAAWQCGLDFIPLSEELYKLAVPYPFISHPHIAKFLEYTIQALKSMSKKNLPGYGFEQLGKIETIGKPLSTITKSPSIFE